MLLRSLRLQRDKRARVTGADDAGRDRRLDSRAAAEKPKRLRHRNAVLADLLRDLLMREPKFFGQPLETAGLFNGVQVRALKVLDEAKDELRVVARRAARQRRSPAMSS